MRPKLRSSFCSGVGFLSTLSEISRFVSCSVPNIFLSLVVFHFCVVHWITCVSRCFVIQSMPEDGEARRSHRDHQLWVRKAFLLSLLSLRRLEEIAEKFWKGWSRGKAQTSGEKCGKFVNCGKQIKARRRTTPATSEKSSTFSPCEGEIVVHSNVNVSTPQLATCVIYFVPFRCCLLIQPAAKLILIDFMEIKNLGEKCHSCLQA